MMIGGCYYSLPDFPGNLLNDLPSNLLNDLPMAVIFPVTFPLIFSMTFPEIFPVTFTMIFSVTFAIIFSMTFLEIFSVTFPPITNTVRSMYSFCCYLSRHVKLPVFSDADLNSLFHGRQSSKIYHRAVVYHDNNILIL